MASNLVKFHSQFIRTSKPNVHFKLTQIQYPSFFSPPLHHLHCDNLSTISLTKSRFPQCALSSPTPPTTKEEAISQAKTSLSTTLEKPLNNAKLAGRLKKLKQPRFRVEIPVIDDSPSSLSQLAIDVFADMPIKRKGSKIKILILWPDKTLAAAAKAFETRSSSTIVENLDVLSVTNGDNTRILNLNSSDVVVFLAPEVSQLEAMKNITDNLYPKPVVIFNPKWGFEEEGSFGELSGFVGSFEVVYSFMGLEVRGVLNRRKGVVFKCVRDGVLSGERWNVLVEEEGELKLVSTFKSRPSFTEVENVLYNLMAMNSPLTKSAKFLKGLMSNVTVKEDQLTKRKSGGSFLLIYSYQELLPLLSKMIPWILLLYES
ncbi:uncharacterized protein LOC116010444 isoform X1 [Ipomoea triloba]|uniref:uncharacterized protein LOC116010444 isoform X1 n=1 Tax=Ipomoea triloba TaxID=35885 RepID=UPI00125E2ACE|nr:uncharacterized protein LOC116010444 isoform X1 [Ipomoea triloba]